MTNAQPLATAVADLVRRMLPEGFADAAIVAAACEWTVRAIADGNACVPLSRLAGQPLDGRSEPDDDADETDGADAGKSAAPGPDAPAFPAEDALADIRKKYGKKAVQLGGLMDTDIK